MDILKDTKAKMQQALEHFEKDLKKLIALSTLSHLGFIGLSFSLGLLSLSFFHLLFWLLSCSANSKLSKITLTTLYGSAFDAGLLSSK